MSWLCNGLAGMPVDSHKHAILQEFTPEEIIESVNDIWESYAHSEGLPPKQNHRRDASGSEKYVSDMIKGMRELVKSKSLDNVVFSATYLGRTKHTTEGCTLMSVMDQLVAVQLQLQEVTNVPTNNSQIIAQISARELPVSGAPYSTVLLGILSNGQGLEMIQ